MNRDADAVLVLSQYCSIGGLERSVVSLCAQLNRGGNRPAILASYDRMPGVLTLEREIKAARIPFFHFEKGGGFSLKTLWNLWTCTKKNRIRIIHSHDIGPLMYGGLLKLLSLGRLKLVHTQHSFVNLDARKRDRLYLRGFSQLADAVCVVSQSLQPTYAELGIGRDRVTVVPNGVSFPDSPISNQAIMLAHRNQLVREIRSQKVGEKLSERLSSVWVLCLGRLHRGKGQDRVIEIWNSVDPEIRARATLLFVGPETSPGEQKRLEQLAKGVSDTVCFVGASSFPLSWTQVSDCYISASEYEGLPLGPVEAAGAGIPVILSDIPGHRFLKELPKWIQFERFKEAANAVEELIELRSFEWKSAVWKSRLDQWRKSSWVRECFGVDTMVKAYSHIYGDVNGDHACLQ